MKLHKLVGAAVRSPDIQLLGGMSAIALLVGMVAFHSIEDMRWLDALYLSCMTLTTVGYGDFSPQTDAGKVFAMLYALFGLGVIAGFIGLVGDLARDVARAEREKRQAVGQP